MMMTETRPTLFAHDVATLGQRQAILSRLRSRWNAHTTVSEMNDLFRAERYYLNNSVLFLAFVEKWYGRMLAREAM